MALKILSWVDGWLRMVWLVIEAFVDIKAHWAQLGWDWDQTWQYLDNLYSGLLEWIVFDCFMLQ